MDMEIYMALEALSLALSTSRYSVVSEQEIDGPQRAQRGACLGGLVMGGGGIDGGAARFGPH